ncbi:ROK family protein [Sphingomonas yabuuchiae]|uniref:ROK family protein n=1 Tax=Sphingomonas yabuuchiae TaxID=172044 RepID=UPI003D97B89A
MTEAQDRIVAGVELGGTKSIVLIGRGRDILVSERLPTTTPAVTLAALRQRLAEWREQYKPEALGIGSFGPIALDKSDADYGHMLATPKPGWAGADVAGALAEGFGERVAIHTDVTGAALAEGQWGAARGLADHVYVTVGTGVGMGIIVNGQPVSGRMHPEAGHVRVRRMAGDDFVGACPFHGDCLEGLVAGPGIAARVGRPAQELAQDDPAWTFVADALAESFAGLFLTLACGRIVIGGGVGVGQPQLLDMVRAATVEKLSGYLPFVNAAEVANRIVHAQLGDQAGPLGTLALARTVLD